MSNTVGVQSKIKAGHSPNIDRYTPKEIMSALGVVFDLDPCAPIEDCPSKKFCVSYYALPDQDGLELPWHGRVWLNPPFARGEVKKWIRKAKLHNNCICLVTSYFTSSWFQDYPPDGIYLLADRPRYIVPKNNNSTVTGRYPSMLMSYGLNCTEILEGLKSSRLKGHFYAKF